MPFAETWTDLEIIILNTVSQRTVFLLWPQKAAVGRARERERIEGGKKGKGRGVIGNLWYLFLVGH